MTAVTAESMRTHHPAPLASQIRSEMPPGRRPLTLAERTLAMMLLISTSPASAMESLQERRRNSAGPIVVIFVVAIAVLLVLAAAMSVAVVIYCANKAMDFEWFVKTSWFEVKIACST